MNFKSDKQRKAVMANLNKTDIANLYKKPKSVNKSLPFSDSPKGDNHLPIEIAIIVPSTQDINKPIGEVAHAKRIRETNIFLTNMLGGYTTVRTTGGYKMGEEVITEPGAKVTAFGLTDKYHEHKEEIKEWILKKKQEWGQDSMSYEFEGDMYLL